MAQFPAYANNQLRHLFNFGPAFTVNFISSATSNRHLLLIPLLQRGGYANFIFNIIRERESFLYMNELSAILISEEFSNDQLLEILNDIDRKMASQIVLDANFMTQIKLIPSMIRGTFQSADLLNHLGKMGYIHLCTLQY